MIIVIRSVLLLWTRNFVRWLSWRNGSSGSIYHFVREREEKVRASGDNRVSVGDRRFIKATDPRKDNWDVKIQQRGYKMTSVQNPFLIASTKCYANCLIERSSRLACKSVIRLISPFFHCRETLCYGNDSFIVAF